MSDCVCGRCEDPEDAELSALRAEVERLNALIDHETEMRMHADMERDVAEAKVAGDWPNELVERWKDRAEAAEAEVVRLNRMISDALLDPSEVAKLRKVADAAREYRSKVECYEEMIEKYGYGADVTFDIGRQTDAAGVLLDAALAGLGEPNRTDGGGSPG